MDIYQELLSHIKVFGHDRDSKVWRQGVSESVRKILEQGNFEGLGEVVVTPNRFGVRGSPVPWVALLTPEISASAQSGYYPLLVLDAETEVLWVGLAVAWNRYARSMSRRAALEANLAAQVRLLAGLKTPLGSVPLRLSSDKNFARVLEQVGFGGYTVNVYAENAVSELKEALGSVLVVYAEILAIKNPGYVLYAGDN